MEHADETLNLTDDERRRFEEKYRGGAAKRSDEELRQEKERLDESAFRLVKVGDLPVAKPDWLIRGYLERNQLASIFGDTGSGKSFLAIDWACRIATGTYFYEHPVKPGPVIYIAGEGQAGITRRLRAWQIRNDINLDDAPLYVSLHPAQLVNRESARAVLDAVKRVADSVGEPAMVIIDTLARNFGPGDENSTQDMNAAIEAADAIRANWGPVVLFIHHTGHGEKGRARGASSFRAALDTELRLDKDEDGVVRLEATKTKDGRPPEPMAFTINTVELGIFDDEGEELDSAILNPTDYEPPQTKKPRPLGDTQKLLLETLETVTETHRENLQADGRDPETARVTVADWREACRRKGVKRNRFHEAKKSLEKREYVTVESGFVRRVRPNQASVRTPFKGGFGHDGRSAPGHFGRESDDSSDAPSDGGEEEGEIL